MNRVALLCFYSIFLERVEINVDGGSHAADMLYIMESVS